MNRFAEAPGHPGRTSDACRAAARITLPGRGDVEPASSHIRLVGRRPRRGPRRLCPDRLPGTPQSERSCSNGIMKPVLFPGRRQFWFETLRTLGRTAYGGTDVGEVLTTAQNIAPGDYDSWHDEWGLTADRIAAKAEAQLTAGDRTSARDRLMRASNYYRTARRLPRPSITTLAMMSRRSDAGWALCRR